ncbi:MAG: hypothetical protein AAF570_09710, partial [Bacteroidota bacterium]
MMNPRRFIRSILFFWALLLPITLFSQAFRPLEKIREYRTVVTHHPTLFSWHFSDDIPFIRAAKSETKIKTRLGGIKLKTKVRDWYELQPDFRQVSYSTKHNHVSILGHLINQKGDSAEVF